jgi:hypothetical protein
LSFIFPDLNLQNWFNLTIGSIVSIILFIIALRIDKASTLKMFALLDNDKRKILELLEVEKSFKDLENALQKDGFSDSIKLDNNIRSLKKAGLIKQRDEIEGNKKIKKLMRQI